jgi:flagellin-like hook-associated protein FlgL
MAAFTRDQIMTEASTAMLAQANQSSMTVMKLLG